MAIEEKNANTNANDIDHHRQSFDDDFNCDTDALNIGDHTNTQVTETTETLPSQPTHCRYFRQSKHNSLVDFSFIMDQTSTNTLTLTHLNSLFEKIVDRHSMGISAEKLYKLILKTDLNKHKIEWYRCKLGLECSHGANAKESKSNASEKSEEHKLERIVSRGPFIAMFKHEKIAFVNSLDTAARSVCVNRSKKKRKSKNKNRRSSNGSGSHSVITNDWTIKNSVKTEPVRRSVEGVNVPTITELKSKQRSRSPKRKKMEDKMGMIIVAEIDHDEISAVSVSPTSETSDCGVGNGIDLCTISGGKNVMTRDSSNSQSSGSVRSHKGRKSSTRKSSRKERRTRKVKNGSARGGGRGDSLLRSIRSIGDGGSRSDEDICDDGSVSSCTTATSSSVSLFTSKPSKNTTRNRRRTKTLTSHDESDVASRSLSAEMMEEDLQLHKHERKSSNEEPTVDIRKVMEDSTNIVGGYRYRNRDTKHLHHSQNYHYNDMYPNPHMYQMSSGYANEGHHHPHLMHPSSYMNPTPPHQHPHYYPAGHLYHYNMHWHPQPYYDTSSGTEKADGNRDGDIIYEECLFLKGLASIVKKIFGLEKKPDLLDNDSSPDNNEDVDSRHQAAKNSVHLRNNQQSNNYPENSAKQQDPPASFPEPVPIPFHQHDSRSSNTDSLTTNRPRTRSRVYSDDEDLERDCRTTDSISHYSPTKPSSSVRQQEASFSTTLSHKQATEHSSAFSSLGPGSAMTDMFSTTSFSSSASSSATSHTSSDKDAITSSHNPNSASNRDNDRPLKDHNDRIERVLSFQLKKSSGETDDVNEQQQVKSNRPRLYSCPEHDTGKKMRQKMRPLPSLTSGMRKSNRDKLSASKQSASIGSSSSQNSKNGRSASKSKKLKERSSNSDQSNRRSDRPKDKAKPSLLLSSSSKPSSIAGLSRSKTDGIRMLRSGSAARPSLSHLPLSRSSSLGSSTASRSMSIGGDRRSYSTLLNLR